MRRFILNLILLSVLSGCTSRQSSGAGQSATGEDSLDLLVETADSENVDSSFDEFINKFMNDSLFQRKRIQFPLSYIQYGRQQKMDAGQWVYDRIYSQNGIYTLVSDSIKDFSNQVSDAAFSHTIDMVSLKQKVVRRYKFLLQHSCWKLNELEILSLQTHKNYDFYEFYQHFIHSDDFQLRHIQDPFHFQTFDSDEDTTIEGMLNREQWCDYSPVFSPDTLIDVNRNVCLSDQCTVLIYSPFAGMSCSLSFVRQGRTWMLHKLVN